MAKSRLAAASSRSSVAAGAPQAPVGALADAAWERLEPAALAWEFLRRNPDYVADYRGLRAGRLAALPAHWGLVAPIDPDAVDVDPRAIWRTPGRAAASPPAAGSLAGVPRASARR